MLVEIRRSEAAESSGRATAADRRISLLVGAIIGAPEPSAGFPE
jgi:hypothetical protein